MFHAFLDLLFRPGEFFGAREEPRLRWAALAALATAVPPLAVGLLVLGQLRNLVPPRGLVIGAGLLVAVIPAFAVVTWLATAGLLYALALPFSGRGDLRRLVAYVGWGMLPQGVTAVVVAGVVAFALAQLQPPVDEATAREFARQLRGGSVVALAAAAGTARATVTGSLTQVKTAAAVTGALWSGYVWVAAVARARGLSRRRAALVVAVPVLLYLRDALPGTFGLGLVGG